MDPQTIFDLFLLFVGLVVAVCFISGIRIGGL